jgi:hypothetical protein
MGRKRISPNDGQDRELLLHIKTLGLETVEGYRRWCAENGFSCRLKKDWRERCRERSKVKKAVIERRIEQAKHEQRKPAQLFKDICELRLTADDVKQPHLKRLCHAIKSHRADVDPPCDPQSLLRLLQHLHSCRVDLVALAPAIPEFGQRLGNSLVESLVLISAQHRAWLRPRETWKPRSHNVRRQMASLLRHLFVQYDDMPLCFDSVWFTGSTPAGAKQRQAYMRVGRGESLRSCELPIPYTKRMAHYIKKAPSDLTFEKALRFGQIVGLGGDPTLARAIVATRLGDGFDHDDFWITVIEWFIAQPMLDRVHVGPIVDYLHTQRFVSVPAAADNRREPMPAELNLTMKGRTSESLLRKVDVWHRKLAKENAQPGSGWSPAGIKSFEFTEGSQANSNWKFWTIRELLNHHALVVEGRELRHCVASYAGSCRRGICSIWTMEVQSATEKSKRLTIEVRNQARIICQARGKANRRPTEKEQKVLGRWATQAGLTISGYV